MVPPVPIPNTVVKHSEAESTCLETDWEDRKLPVKQELRRGGALFCARLYVLAETCAKMKADYSFCSIGLYYEEDFMIEEFKKFIMRGGLPPDD